MMGRRVMTEPLFYTFRLEDHVPTDHAWRAVDALLDTAFVRRVMAPRYCAIGRFSIDPELMVRMLLVGYLSGIRSERMLCVEVHLNLAHRWLCRLDLDGAVPDHSMGACHAPTLAYAQVQQGQTGKRPTRRQGPGAAPRDIPNGEKS